MPISDRLYFEQKIKNQMSQKGKITGEQSKIQIKKMLKIKNGFDNMQRELLVNNASQLLSKNNKDIISKKQQENMVKSTKIDNQDRDQIRLKLLEYYKKKAKNDDFQVQTFNMGPKSNHTSQIENEIQDHIEILGIEQTDLLASAPIL